MLKIISSKNEGEIYGLAKKEKESFYKNLNIKISNFQDCFLDDTITNAENVSIFGDISSFLIRVSRGEDIEKINLNILTSLEKSQHFFMLIGSGIVFEKKIEEVKQESQNTKEYDSLKNLKVLKIESIKVNDFPSEMVAALQKHDKKNSWNLLLQELKNKDAEPVHGSCIFAYKSLLTYMVNPKNNGINSGVKDYTFQQAKRNAVFGKREKQEVSDKYFNLVLAYHLARNGEGSLESNLERWVLEN